MLLVYDNILSFVQFHQLCSLCSKQPAEYKFLQKIYNKYKIYYIVCFIFNYGLTEHTFLPLCNVLLVIFRKLNLVILTETDMMTHKLNSLNVQSC